MSFQTWDAQYWRDKLGIHIGMTKAQALDKFISWRENKRTCLRCEGEKYIEFCPVHLICEEANNADWNDNGGGTVQANEHETLRTGLSEKRKRTPLR